MIRTNSKKIFLVLKLLAGQQRGLEAKRVNKFISAAPVFIGVCISCDQQFQTGWETPPGSIGISIFFLFRSNFTGKGIFHRMSCLHIKVPFCLGAFNKWPTQIQETWIWENLGCAKLSIFERSVDVFWLLSKQATDPPVAAEFP